MMSVWVLRKRGSREKSDRSCFSLFGRLSYNYSDRYLFTGTLRADGSSKFARGQQWGYFLQRLRRGVSLKKAS